MTPLSVHLGMNRKSKGKKTEFLKSKRLTRPPSTDRISIEAILDATVVEPTAKLLDNIAGPAEVLSENQLAAEEIQPANSEEELRQNLKEIDEAVSEGPKLPKSHSRQTSLENSDGSAHSARRIVFVPKQSSRESANNSPSAHQNSQSDGTQFTSIASPTVRKLAEVDSPPQLSPLATQPNSPQLGKPSKKDDLGQRILALCQKKEWLMVENLVRSNKVKPAQLTAKDEVRKISLRKGSRRSLDNISNPFQLGMTPIMHVVKEGVFQLADKLLELGADLNAMTHVSFVAFFANLIFTQWLSLQDGCNLTHLAAKYGNVEHFRYLVSKNMDLSTPGGVSEGVNQSLFLLIEPVVTHCFSPISSFPCT